MYFEPAPTLTQIFVPKAVRTLIWKEPKYEEWQEEVGEEGEEKGIWVDPHSRGPDPAFMIDFQGRLPLIWASSPSIATFETGSKNETSSSRVVKKPLHILQSLPLELRLQIWSYVLSRQALHLLLSSPAEESDGKAHFRSHKCVSSLPERCDGCYGSPPASVLGKFMGLVGGKRERRRDGGRLALLLTCRQIYTESHPLLLSPFSTSEQILTISPPTIYHLSRLLLPSHLHAIRSLNFTYQSTQWPPLPPSLLSLSPQYTNYAQQQYTDWATIWVNLSLLPHLHILKVRFKVLPVFWASLNDESARALLDPIREVTGPRDFVITVPFPPDEGPGDRAGYRLNAWSKKGGWGEGLDLWDGLPCRVERVASLLMI